MKKCLCGKEASFSSQIMKKLNLCEDCKRELYLELAKNIVPKGLESPYSPKKLIKM